MTSPRLYLIAPAPLTAGDVEGCIAALAAGDVASLLIAGAASGGDALAGSLTSRAQVHNVAVLIGEDPALAMRFGADGVHLAGAPNLAARYRSARERLGPQAIVGVGIGASRHEAMELGEMGADYLAFEAVAHGAAGPDLAARRGMIDWWAELFGVPCVAWDVPHIDEAAALARAGADFIAIGDAISRAGEGCAADVIAAFDTALGAGGATGGAGGAAGVAKQG